MLVVMMMMMTGTTTTFISIIIIVLFCSDDSDDGGAGDKNDDNYAITDDNYPFLLNLFRNNGACLQEIGLDETEIQIHMYG